MPLVEPRTFRKVFGEIANLVWWMGRGRYRGVSRTQDVFRANVPNIKELSKKELLNVCLNIGGIGGVPVLDFEGIEDIADFPAFRDFLISLGPSGKVGEIHSGNVKIAKKCAVFDNKDGSIDSVLEKSLRSTGVSKVTNIAYYL